MALDKKKFAQHMLSFIEKSPTCFHTVANVKEELRENGFIELKEAEKWVIEENKKYFVTRNGSSVIAFKMPNVQEYEGFAICASHSDSPSFKLKENPEMKDAGYVKLNVEKYGGMLCAPWYDRPLSIAGRIAYTDKESEYKILTKLVNIDRDLVLIPNLAIHMNRDANSSLKYNVQDDMLPVLSLSDTESSLIDIVSSCALVNKEDILSCDLYLYNRDKGTFWGANNEFIASPRLDDLECVYSSMKAFIEAQNSKKVAVFAVFDNEEVGSGTRQGADSSLLESVLKRITLSTNKSEEDFYVELAQSFLVSADNAHGVHPNFVSKADPVNRPLLNGGIVIKFNAAQKYTTDSLSASLFEKICKSANVPYQFFTNRSDIAGGSTLGNISTAHVSIPSVDIGLAQWAMHSPMESAGADDAEYLKNALVSFYSTDFCISE